MAYATANGFDIITARIALPRVGVWHADLTVDTPDGLSGRVDLAVGLGGGLSLSGTVQRGGVLADASIVRVVGGAGGLGKTMPARPFRLVPLSSPLAAILQAAGEVLSPRADNPSLATFLPYWVIRRDICSNAIRHLVEEQLDAASWRVLPDGGVWVGPERWPASALVAYELLRTDPLVDRLELYAEDPTVYPGETFEGRRVSYVEHSIEEEGVRTRVWLE